MLFIVLLLFVGLAALLAWYLIAHDKGEKEPIAVLWLAAGFGMAGAFMAAFLEGFLVNDAHFQLGAPHGALLAASLTIGVVEEACKFIPLALFLYKKRYFNEHTDGVIYFALAGLGFGLPENIIYTVEYGTKVGMTRLLLTPLFHAAITGLIGYFLIRHKLLRRPPLGVAVPLVGAMLLHGLYDFGLMSAVPVYTVAALLITASVSCSLFVLFLRATQQDQELGLSVVGNNAFCRSCGQANQARKLYCAHCGKSA